MAPPATLFLNADLKYPIKPYSIAVAVHTKMGKHGQTFSVFLTGVSGVQTSRRFTGRRAEPKTTLRQFRHTWTIVRHDYTVTSGSLLLEPDSCSNRTFLGGQRRGVHRSSSRLYHTQVSCRRRGAINTKTCVLPRRPSVIGSFPFQRRACFPVNDIRIDLPGRQGYGVELTSGYTGDWIIQMLSSKAIRVSSLL